MSHFNELYKTVRTLLGDVALIPSYSSNQLDFGISLALLQDVAFSEGAEDVTGGHYIEPDVTEKADKMRISIKAAICLLSPSSGAFSYRTKVLSVTRENGNNAHLGYLKELLRQVTDGEVTCASETEWDLFLRGSLDAVVKLSRFPD